LAIALSFNTSSAAKAAVAIPIPLPFCLSCTVGCGPVGVVPCAGWCGGSFCWCACGQGPWGTWRCTCR
jgi:hypothetical protein